MKHTKKLTALFLALVMCATLCVPAFAATTESIDTRSQEYLLSPSGERTSTTIAEVDALIEMRLRALLQNDTETAESITSQLYALGGRPSTSEEIAALGESASPLAALANVTTSETYTSAQESLFETQSPRFY